MDIFTVPFSHIILPTAICSFMIFLLSANAGLLRLIDKPSGRKQHRKPVPTVGGLAVVLSLLLSTVLLDIHWPFENIILYLAAALMIVGWADDVLDLRASIRLIVFFGVAALTVFVGGVELASLGNLFGFGEIQLGYAGPVVTIIAIVAGMNAFNMIDGIDGLLAVFLMNALVFLLIVSSGFGPLFVLLLSLIAIFFIANLGVKLKGEHRQIFMGDSGSITFGFLIVCLVVTLSQGEHQEIRPVTALWIIAIPLMDLVAIMIRRLRKGQSLMKADREHLHHIFMRLGLSDRKTLFVIAIVTAFCSLVGIAGEIYQWPDVVMFGLFLLFFAGYLYFILNCWRLTKVLKLLSGK